ncbi:cold-shock DNA-binding protein family [bacterium A37T11]|nr:cold-shock DNA-binding protein family [bacterium A37T11]
MARSQETFIKKENVKKRLQKKKDKEQRKEQRKANSDKGKGLDEMMAYIDENGNISDVPPDPKKMRQFNADDIRVSVPKLEELEMDDPMKVGTVTYYNEEKGYGFITEGKTGERIFIHANDATEPIAFNDKLQFKIKRGHRGLQASEVSKYTAPAATPATPIAPKTTTD